MLKDIIYDFDGTVSDTYPVFTEALVKMLAERGTDTSYDEAYRCLKVTLAHAFAHYGLPRDFGKEFHKVHYVLAVDHQKPIDGAADILRYAAENGGRNFIFTHSGAEVKQLLGKWGMLDYITDIVDATVDVKRKPAPDGVFYLMERNGIKPSEAVIVGDRNIDVEAGHGAGIKGVLFDPDGFVAETDAEYSITKLEELKNIILK